MCYTMCHENLQTTSDIEDGQDVFAVQGTEVEYFQRRFMGTIDYRFSVGQYSDFKHGRC